DTLATIGIIADAHVRDEESPARVPFLDRFGSPVDSTFRPQEALSAQVLDASVRAVRSQQPDALIVAGDLADNAQANELDLALTVLRGGRARPDSGARGYDGVQRAGNVDPLFYRPDTDAPRHPGLLARAQRPFRVRGVGAPILPVMGNHDLLVQGELPPDERTREIAVSGSMVTELRERPDIPDDASSGAARVAALRAILAGPELGPSRRVAPDAERRELGPEEVVERLRDVAGAPGPSSSLDYAADVGSSLRVLTLDAVDRAGGSDGAVSAAALQWLRAQIARAGSRSLIVASHQPLRSSAGGEQVLAGLDQSPAVIATVSGHTHRHRIRPRPSASGGYWEIETASLADHPQQARMLRLVGTQGGGRALETWVVDHDGAGLADTARELAFLDVQGGRPRQLDATRRDRNVRLGLEGR
ncbi:MAG: metallophosphoesterase family protein, partial [Solirubrobacteraceae bacterium]